MKHVLILLLALTACGTELPNYAAMEIRKELGRATEAARRLHATVAVLDDTPAAQMEAAVLQGQLSEYETRRIAADLRRQQIALLDKAVESAKQRGGASLIQVFQAFYRTRNRDSAFSAWTNYRQAVAAREAAQDKVTELARLERDLESIRAGIASGDPIAGLPAGMTIDQVRHRLPQLTRALAEAGRVPPSEINLVRGRLAEAEADVRRLQSELARATAEPTTLAPETPPIIIDSASIEPPRTPSPSSVPPSGTAELYATVINTKGYGVPDGFEDDEQCTWEFTVQFTVANGIPVQLRLDSLHREPAGIQFRVASWEKSSFYVPPSVAAYSSARAFYDAINWTPGQTFLYDLGPHTLTVARRDNYSGTYRAVFSGKDIYDNPVSVTVVWASPGRPPVGPPRIRPTPVPPSQPVSVSTTGIKPGIYRGGLDSDSLKYAKEKKLGFELLNLTGNDATVRILDDGRIELQGSFNSTMEVSGLLDRGTTKEVRYFQQYDTTFTPTEIGTMRRLVVEYRIEDTFRVHRTNRVTGLGPRPSVLGQTSPPKVPDRHKSTQGKRIANIKFDDKTGDLLLYIIHGTQAVPTVPWRLKRQ